MAILHINSSPVNQMSADFMNELNLARRWALAEAIVPTGTGKNFVVSGDVTQILPVTDKTFFVERLMWAHNLFDAIDRRSKLVIVALNGNCLGGDLEMTMACHYRMVAQVMNVGLLEVKLGLVPGSADTRRLPRLIGLPNALEYMTRAIP